MHLTDIIEAARLHRINSTEAVTPMLQHTFHRYFKVCACGRKSTVAPVGPDPLKEICPDALERALNQLIIFSPDDVDAGLRNIGQDPTCGACMGTFYTGIAGPEEHTCTPADSTEQDNPVQKVFRRMIEDERSCATFDSSADDPLNAYYWEIDHPHIQHLAEALQVAIPSEKDPS